MNRPLHPRVSRALLATLIAATSLLGCSSPPKLSEEAQRVPAFKALDTQFSVDFISPESAEQDTDPVYSLGPGDVLQLQVWGRPDLSGKHVLGPDGRITVPVIGPIEIAKLSREEAAQVVRQRLDRFYIDPQVQVSVEQYVSNRITVLGRVENPGMLSFDHNPTLLEVLAKARSLPVMDKQALLQRCAVVRGRDKLIWVDLKRLLRGGDLRLNLRMKPGDLVYIPDSADTMVYVMGAVNRPGAYPLTHDMSVMGALASAGGPNEEGKASEIGIYRPARQAFERVPLQSLMDGKQPVNFVLEPGDVIYVPKSAMATFGYFTRQLGAGLSFMTFGATLGK